MNNIVYEPGYEKSVVVTNPASPNAGDPCRVNYRTGIAVTKIGEGGNDATHTTVNFGPFECSIPVTGTEGAISAGDPLFYDDAIGGVNNNSAGYPFGIALAAVGGAVTATINVFHGVLIGGFPTALGGAGSITNAMLAAFAATGAKIAAGAITEDKLDPSTNLTLNAPRTARFVWDFATDAHAVGTVAFRGAALPAKARIVSGKCYVKTALTGPGGTTASIQVTGAGDIVADTAVAGDPWATADAMQPIVPVNTKATCVKVEAGGGPSLVITTHDLTAGHIDLWLDYVVHD